MVDDILVTKTSVMILSMSRSANLVSTRIINIGVRVFLGLVCAHVSTEALKNVIELGT